MELMRGVMCGVMCGGFVDFDGLANGFFYGIVNGLFHGISMVHT